MERISKHISYAEAVKSQTAVRKGIDNNPTEEQLDNMRYLAVHVFEQLRSSKNVPIAITSFYRSEQLNIAIGGSKSSQHRAINGAAAMDIDADVYHNEWANNEIFYYIKERLDFDQLIWEFGDDINPSWVHVSIKKDGGNRCEILKAVRVDDRVRYLPY